MTKDEALTMALEALESVLDDSPKVLDASISGGLYEVVQCREAITAIKEALAQPEVFSKQNYLNGYCVGQSDLLAEQAKQEPAAWMVYTQDGQSVYVTDNPTDIESNQRALPLYATPQRAWVDLTDDEIKAIVGPWGSTEIKGYTRTLFDQIEAALKEKNT